MTARPNLIPDPDSPVLPANDFRALGKASANLPATPATATASAAAQTSDSAPPAQPTSRLGGVWHAWRQVHGARAQRREAPARAGLTAHRLALTSPWPEDVSALFAQAAVESIEISQAWYENLFSTVFQAHPDAALWVLRLNGVAVAAFPALVDPAPGGRELTALGNYYTALYAPTLAPDLLVADLAVLLHAMRQHYGNLGRLSFQPMDPQSSGHHKLLQALEMNGLLCFQYFRFGNWTLPNPGRWDSYFAGRSGNLRSRAKRATKRMTEEGGHIDIVTRPDLVASALAAYWQVYRASWKQYEGHPAFIDGLARWSAEQGHLRMGVYWLNGQPIAAQIWLVSHGKAEIFKVAYDEAYKALSPGTALMAALLKPALDQDRVTEVDFLIGDDAYKRDWMSHRRERWGIEAYDPLTLSGLLGLSKVLIARLARRLKPAAREATAADEPAA